MAITPTMIRNAYISLGNAEEIMRTYCNVADQGHLFHDGQQVWASELIPMASTDAEFPVGSMIRSAIVAVRDVQAKQSAMRQIASLLQLF